MSHVPAASGGFFGIQDLNPSTLRRIFLPETHPPVI
jgi:hypothetical protein